MNSESPRQEVMPEPVSWAAYLGRIQEAAAAIARGHGYPDDGSLTFPDELPEYQPEFLGHVLADAIAGVSSAAEVTDDEWDRWQPHISALIRSALPWPEATRIRAIALTTVRNRLGILFSGGERHLEAELAELRLDIRSWRIDNVPTDQLAALQLVLGDRILGIGFSAGISRVSPQSLIESMGRQAEDFSLRASFRLLGTHPEFWRSAARALFRKDTGERFAGMARHRRRLRMALANGANASVRHLLASGTSPKMEMQGVRPLIDGTSIPILMYHRVADEGDPGLARFRVTPAQFRLHMEFLSREGFTTISLEALRGVGLGRERLPPRPILITFDDGYCDFYDHAWPILRELNFLSTMFIVTGKAGGVSDWDQHLGRSEPLMNWQRISEIAANGVSIGSHSVMHPRFSRLSIREAHTEMAVSAAAIRENLGYQPFAFCYPYGVFDRSVEQILPGCGYELGFTCETNVASMAANALRLPRIEVMGTDTALTIGRRLRDLGVSVSRQ